MALRFLDSFDHYASNNSQSTSKWTTVRGGGNTGVTTTTGRFGLGAVGSTNRQIRKNFPDNQSTWIIGVAAQMGMMPANASDSIITVYDGGTAQTSLCYSTITHKWEWRRNGIAGTLFGPSYQWVPASNQWYYIEVKIVLSQTVGVVTMRLDGTQVMNATGQDTCQTTNEYGNGVAFNSTQDNTNVPNLDDVYILDGVDSGISGCPNNAFLGDIRVECKHPNGNGNSSQFVGQDLDSTNNYLNVDDVTPDDVSTYNGSGTVNNKDTYAYEDLAVTAGTVYGVQLLPRVAKTDAGTKECKSVARLSTTEVDGPTQSVGTNYAYAIDIRNGDPLGNQWTISNFNSAEFGLKVTV